MGAAEAAELIVTLRLRDMLSGGLTKAGTAARTATSHLSRLGSTLGTVKRNLGGLITGPVGLIGLGGALFGVEKFLSTSISKAVDFGEAVSKISKVTGLATQQTSALVDALDYYGVTTDKALKLTGFLEKSVGNLTKGTGIAAAKFTADFGFSLKNTTINADDLGNALETLNSKLASHAEKNKAYDLIQKYTNASVKDANTLILQAADYFTNKAIPAGTRAAAMAKLFGRSWQDLIPVLSLGRKGVQKALDDAIKLSDQDIANMQAAKEASREWNDALGDLQITIGAKILPSLTKFATTASAFVRNNSDKIVEFFQKAAKFAEQAGAAIQNTVVPAIGQIADMWGRIPDDLKKLLVGGFVANKLTGGAVTGLAGLGLKGIGGALGGMRGSTPATPVFVSDVGGGIAKGLGGLTGAGGLSAASGVAGISALAGPVAILAGIAVAGAMARANLVGPNAPLNLRGNAFGQNTAGMPGQVPANYFSKGGGTPTRIGVSEGMRTGAEERARELALNTGEMHRLGISVADLSHNVRRESMDRAALYAREKRALGDRNRLGVVRQGGKDAVLIGDTLAQKFAHSQAPFYRSSKNAERALSALRSLQQRFLAVGDTKTAARIGRDITSLKRSIAGMKPPKVTVNVSTTVSIRDQFATERRAYSYGFHKSTPT